MKRRMFSKPTIMWAGDHLKRVSLILVIFNIVLLFCPGTSMAQTGDDEKYTITLQSRSFTPQPGIQPLLQDSLSSQLGRGETRHVYLQLRKHISSEERASLEELGVRLLSYVGSGTWYAALSDRRPLEFTSPTQVTRTPVIGNIRWIGEIQREDKISRKILDEGVGEYNRLPDGRVDITVIFFPDIPPNDVRAVVGRYGELIQQPGMLNDVVVRLRESDIQRLSSEDAVQWIGEVGPPDEDLNDGAAVAAGINPLWAAPYGLGGTNVQVGQWETGNPDDTHGDLIGRVTIVENEGVSDHATHVAGIVAGDGSLSAGEGGAASQWRGVADQADVVSFSVLVDNLEAEDHDDAININGIDVSTNSWSAPGNNYQARSVKFDRIVRGVYGRPIPVVFGAGNNNNTANSVRQPGGTAKNTIVVGNINSDDNSISIKSSWGPTDEDQTKPDLVAPGDETGGDGGINSCVANLNIDIHTNANNPDFLPGDGADGIDDYAYPYGVKTGTSMATPLVSGVIALMLQQYRETYFNDVTSDESPLPSTFKAILCHTALDLLDNPGGGADLVGPDYVYGYGLVNAEAAVNAIRNRRFREGVILSVDDVDIHTFEVAAGEDELKVTLAWDDVAANVGDVPPNFVKNDLDLILVNPDNDEFYTPWELDTANPTNPATRDFYATEADADAHRDDSNVLEQVVVTNPDPGTWTIKVKADDLPGDDLFQYQRYSLIAGDQPDQRLEGKVDIVQVLDRSGSMSAYTTDASTQRKIEALRSAAAQFINMMTPDIGNQLGMVQFNQDVVPFDPAHDTDLAELTATRATQLTDDAVPAITHGGSTSIGDGLNDALAQLTSLVAGPDHDKVIALVTDGKENSPLWIEDVRDNLINSDVAVYALGLGYGTGINEAKLTELAEATGGTFRITSDELIFRKFFIEILAGAVNWDVLLDPKGELGAGDSVAVPVCIEPGQKSAAFTAHWGISDSDAMILELVTPSGLVITPATSNDRIRHCSAETYAIYVLDLPLAGDLSGELAGEWKMKLKASSELQNDVRYSVSAYGRSPVDFEVNTNGLHYLTGEPLLLEARLMRDGSPVTRASIEVECNIPAIGAGEVLHEGNVSRAELEKDPVLNGDAISLIDRKLQILRARAGAEVLERSATSLKLYDNGTHGDKKADDGIYSAMMTDTEKEGSYTFRFEASGVPGSACQSFKREWTESIFTAVAIDPEFSLVKLVPVDRTADGQRYTVEVVPRDRFGNYLGPGHVVTATVAHTGGPRQVQLDDNIDGTYTKDIFLTVAELDADAKVSIEVDGKPFATVDEHESRWMLSVHAGSAIPTGTFGKSYDPGFSVTLDAEYHLFEKLAVVGLFGYHNFLSGAPSVPDMYWMNISANLKYELTSGRIRPYLSGGAGAYIPETGSTRFGINTGLGLDYFVRSSWIIELGGDYHHTFASSDDTEFVTAHIGIICGL